MVVQLVVGKSQKLKYKYVYKLGRFISVLYCNYLSLVNSLPG